MKLAGTIILGLQIIVVIGCGGNGSPAPTPTPTPVSAPTPVTSGEYLFEGNSGTSLNLATINSTTGALSSTTLLASQANDDVIYPGVAVTPSKRFLYALFTSFTEVQSFQLSGPGLQLTPVLTFLLPTAGPLNSMVLHPSGQFLYVVQSPGTIQEFSTNATTGSLSAGPTVKPGGADLRVAAIDPAGKFMYVTDLTVGRIFAYQINPSNGSLTAVPGSPFTISATAEPNIPVVDSTGHFLYVSLLSGLAGFAIDSSTGALTPIPGSPFSTSSQAVYIAADPVGNFLYDCTSNGLVDGFAINPTTGVLTSVPGSPFSTALVPGNVAVAPSGKFVYVSITTGSSIYGFSLNPLTGSLTPLTGSPFASVSNPSNLFIAAF
jgi:6-phosphogluconolactonase (cycloisomerase 2 family)